MFLKQRLRSTDLLRGVLTVIPSAVVTQAIAAAGADFVLIDREHGPIGPEAMHAMVAATAGTDCAPVVRVPSIDEADTKAALDAGAEGILFPLVRSADDAERCVSYLTYPPSGLRGWGPFVAHSRYQTSLLDYAGSVGPEIACGLLLETVEAVENIDEILRVSGIDFVIAAQFDLSTALGVHGQFDSPAFVEAMTTLETAVASSQLPAGGAAFTPQQTSSLIAKGYRVLVHGFDGLMLKERVETFKTWT
ncbi:MAG: aldolase/citrate lyase family protein [Actinomycetota bacterium]|nr:aldolase/citrate lyase family protein [Actinomycetota bacterium]